MTCSSQVRHQTRTFVKRFLMSECFSGNKSTEREHKKRGTSLLRNVREAYWNDKNMNEWYCERNVLAEIRFSVL